MPNQKSVWLEIRRILLLYKVSLQVYRNEARSIERELREEEGGERNRRNILNTRKRGTKYFGRRRRREIKKILKTLETFFVFF